MTKIVFTSCMDAERVPAQSVWDQIRDEAPERTTHRPLIDVALKADRASL